MQGFSNVMRLMAYLGFFAEEPLPANAETWVRPCTCCIKATPR